MKLIRKFKTFNVSINKVFFFTFIFTVILSFFYIKQFSNKFAYITIYFIFLGILIFGLFKVLSYGQKYYWVYNTFMVSIDSILFVLCFLNSKSLELIKSILIIIVLLVIIIIFINGVILPLFKNPNSYAIFSKNKIDLNKLKDKKYKIYFDNDLLKLTNLDYIVLEIRDNIIINNKLFSLVKQEETTKHTDTLIFIGVNTRARFLNLSYYNPNTNKHYKLLLDNNLGEKSVYVYKKFFGFKKNDREAKDVSRHMPSKYHLKLLTEYTYMYNNNIDDLNENKVMLFDGKHGSGKTTTLKKLYPNHINISIWNEGVEDDPLSIIYQKIKENLSKSDIILTKFKVMKSSILTFFITFALLAFLKIENVIHLDTLLDENIPTRSIIIVILVIIVAFILNFIAQFIQYEVLLYQKGTTTNNRSRYLEFLKQLMLDYPIILVIEDFDRTTDQNAKKWIAEIDALATFLKENTTESRIIVSTTNLNDSDNDNSPNKSKNTNKNMKQQSKNTNKNMKQQSKNTDEYIMPESVIERLFTHTENFKAINTHKYRNIILEIMKKYLDFDEKHIKEIKTNKYLSFRILKKDLIKLIDNDKTNIKVN